MTTLTQRSAIDDFTALGGSLQIAERDPRADPRTAVLSADGKHAELALHPDADGRVAEALIKTATTRLLWFRALGPDRDGWRRARRRWRLSISVAR
ncbi:hypothetical protein [Actinocatenispora comari]|jgi:hypothetical protein|uniref:Uncharacterized protein n=1 Tax=Actinocatenispora comari TaxID=2807577 RepID=A0A8J4EM33_9ACTN|nr:hypothetical protein [Actinocatenispora comari]GIL25469.1 hypothetical protein NUM_07240 [Actinocatenispora comari]GIL29136.1 hypothetical protein NUM_43900 [Actinocatenispora comari]